MLFLLFQLGEDRYALEAGRIVEVLPFVALKRLPQAPPAVAGVFNYRGQPVPAVDLCALATGQAARERLSTRMVIIRYRPEDGSERLLGLVAENATQMLRKSAKDFVDPGVSIRAAPYLGPILMDGEHPIQWVDTQRLLSEQVRELLFSEPAGKGLPAPEPLS